MFKFLKNLCWHDWYYFMYTVVWDMKQEHFPGLSKDSVDAYMKRYKRVCLKCGKYQDTYTGALRELELEKERLEHEEMNRNQRAEALRVKAPNGGLRRGMESAKNEQ